jgi:hypothetical protein
MRGKERIAVKGRVRKLGRSPDSLVLFFVKFSLFELSVIKLLL